MRLVIPADLNIPLRQRGDSDYWAPLSDEMTLAFVTACRENWLWYTKRKDEVKEVH